MSLCWCWVHDAKIVYRRWIFNKGAGWIRPECLVIYHFSTSVVRIRSTMRNAKKLFLCQTHIRTGCRAYPYAHEPTHTYTRAHTQSAINTYIDTCKRFSSEVGIASIYLFQHLIIFLLISITNFTSLDENWFELKTLKIPSEKGKKRGKSIKITSIENKKCNRKFWQSQFTHKRFRKQVKREVRKSHTKNFVNFVTISMLNAIFGHFPDSNVK